MGFHSTLACYNAFGKITVHFRFGTIVEVGKKSLAGEKTSDLGQAEAVRRFFTFLQRSANYIFAFSAIRRAAWLNY